jgi:glycosyltransferase involved in cell wall biosynthesis
MMGWAIHQSVCCGLPYAIIGNNKNIPSSRIAGNWEDLKEQFRSHRVYLYTPIYPYEDGYNLSMLEAMATGMPIATIQHPTSPVRDGVEGYVGATGEELREKAIRLLDNPEEAIRMGMNARACVEKEFSLSKFQHSWQSFASTLQ